MGQALATIVSPHAARSPRPDLHERAGLAARLLFVAVLLAGILLTVFSLRGDIAASGARELTTPALLLLGAALICALAFEFVNGFHDTANAVATVIYTNALKPTTAVVWSGVWNFLGVLAASGAVAYSIISLLPVELIIQVGKGTGFAMVFALLLAAIIWNLGTWYLGLPASSSHTLIGSIIGVGLANQLISTSGATSGVDWAKAGEVALSLLFSPLAGFLVAGGLVLLLRRFLRGAAIFHEPHGDRPPPPAVRGVLILTCTLVSFFHGSNDGQKGMGLVMLILVGILPATYALNRHLPPAEVAELARAAAVSEAVLLQKAGPGGVVPADPEKATLAYLQNREMTPETLPALAAMSGEIAREVGGIQQLSEVPAANVADLRNRLYVVSEALRSLDHSKAVQFTPTESATIHSFRGEVDRVTRYIPDWVKAAIAIALGLGTMVGWRRIVVTVGERIGKQHLTYAQGASAELTAAGMIGVADAFGLPVSTTHVLSSGVAGTMAAEGAGVQPGTIRSIALAWVLTLPASILLAAGFYWLLAGMI